MYVCIYVCMYVCMCEYMYVQKSTHMQLLYVRTYSAGYPGRCEPREKGGFLCENIDFGILAEAAN